jgi:hypothetical protein
MHNAGSAPRPSQRAQRPCGCITTRAPPRVACVSGLGRTRAAPAHPRTHERCQPAESPPTALAEGRVWPQHLDVEQSGRRPWHRQALSMRVGAERHRGACATAACSYARRAARARWCSCAVCAVPAAHGEAVLPQGPSIFCSTRQPRRRCSRRAATSDMRLWPWGGDSSWPLAAAARRFWTIFGPSKVRRFLLASHGFRHRQTEFLEELRLFGFDLADKKVEDRVTSMRMCVPGGARSQNFRACGARTRGHAPSALPCVLCDMARCRVLSVLFGDLGIPMRTSDLGRK